MYWAIIVVEVWVGVSAGTIVAYGVCVVVLLVPIVCAVTYCEYAIPTSATIRSVMAVMDMRVFVFCILISPQQYIWAWAGLRVV